jgi:virulence-associated protein VapD
MTYMLSSEQLIYMYQDLHFGIKFLFPYVFDTPRGSVYLKDQSFKL